MEEKCYWDISKLKEWDKNPRTITKENFEKLKKQIQELGEYKPLVITKDGTVLGGNMRLKAYRELGFKQCWVSVVDAKTEEEKLKYALSDNDQLGEYNKDELVNLISSVDIDLSNFTINLDKSIGLDELLDRYKEVEEDDVPAVEEGEPKSKRGEIYKLGRHRLMCGDATSKEDVERLMNGKKADMVFTDPPYGVNAGEKLKRDIIGDKNINEMVSIVGDVFFNISNNIKESSSYYICSPQGGDMEIIMMMMRDAGIKCKHQLIWKKDSPVFSMGRLDYNYQHEVILYGWKKTHSFFGKNEVSVWEFPRPKASKLHPTMKPVELIKRAILNSSLENNIILDVFGGSGSTLIACEQTNRICYMMEIDPHYCDVIRKRYVNFVYKSEDNWESLTPPI